MDELVEIKSRVTALAESFRNHEFCDSMADCMRKICDADMMAGHVMSTITLSLPSNEQIAEMRKDAVTARDAGT